MIMLYVGTNNTLLLIQNCHAQIFSRCSIGRIEWAVRRLQFHNSPHMNDNGKIKTVCTREKEREKKKQIATAFMSLHFDTLNRLSSVVGHW